MDGNDLELPFGSDVKEYEWFDDYLNDILSNKTNARSYLKNNGTAWDIFEFGEGNQLSSIGINDFDNSFVSKFRSVFKGTCRLYELDDAMVSFALYSINKAAEESGYKELIDLVNIMSDYVEIYNDMDEYALNTGISLIGNKRVVLNVRMPTKAEFETMSVDLMLDKPSLAKTCYWYTVISTSSIAANTEWISDKLFKKNNFYEVTFTCNHFSPYSILLNDFKLKKKLLKTLVFRWMSLIVKSYRLSLLDYLEGNLDDSRKRGLVNKYKVLRQALVLSGRKKDQKLRSILNKDKVHIDKIKKELTDL